MSVIGGKADVNVGKTDIGDCMSVVGGKAGMNYDLITAGSN
jgi:hypothetical protein